MDIKVGDKLRGEVIDFSHEGNGILKAFNKIVFVKGALIGDKVLVKIDQVKKNYAIGSVVEITEPSKDRIKLDFEVTEAKGGIPLIEYAYPKQLEWKKHKVKMDLYKIAGLDDVLVHDTIGMETPYRYRNHVQIPVGDKNGKTIIGFYELNTNEIVDMEESILQAEIGNRILKIIRSWMDKYSIKAYNKRTKKGVLRHIGIRTNRDNEAMVILVTGNDKLPYAKELIDELIKDKVISVYQNVNKLDSSIVYGQKYKLLYGQEKLLDYIGDYKFYLSPRSFFQVNRIQTEVLYKKAVEYLEPKKDDIVYDLYCGIGTISLFVAPYVEKVYGIEIVEEAIEDAKSNAMINNIDNVEFMVGEAEIVLPKLVKVGIESNKVVLDPPRKGCEKEVLDSLVKMQVERIVYVSCNPSTMARDVKYLVENGYKIVEVQPVDMFPHTAHVEAAILMTNCGSETE